VAATAPDPSYRGAGTSEVQMKLSLFGIFTFGKVAAFITSR
jgi:hypothetical protein